MRVGGLIVLGREEVKHSSVMPGVDLFVEPEIPNVSVDQLQSIRGSDSFLDRSRAICDTSTAINRCPSLNSWSTRREPPVPTNTITELGTVTRRNRLSQGSSVGWYQLTSSGDLVSHTMSQCC